MSQLRAATPALLIAVGALSAAAIGYELLLIRLFALVHWHHMVGVAIGLALLGYGASGTFIALAGERLKRHFTVAFVLNALVFSISAPLCVGAAQAVTFDPQSVTWQIQPIGLLAASFLVLAVPFFAAANCIALSLAHYAGQIPRIYGVDLVGAGIGAVVLTLAMAQLHPTQALFAVATLGLAAAYLAASSEGLQRHLVLSFALVFGLASLVFGPIEVRPATYKDLARALSVVGAEPVLSTSGISGIVDVVDNRRVRFREAPGLSLSSMARLPHQLAVFVDGDAAGAIDKSGANANGDDYLADLLSSLPYRLLTHPRVAVLDAGVGRGVAQALALGAREVVAIEVNPLLVALVCDTLAETDPRRCADQRVRWRAGSTRAFAATAKEPFDLLLLNATSDTAGLDALHVDFDLTTEAFGHYLDDLAPGGLLAVEGPSRLPPRQSIRLLATARDALIASGDPAPQARLALLRGWQRYLLLVFERPISLTQQLRLRDAAADGGFDVAWLPGITRDEVNLFQRLADPVYFDAARAVLTSEPLMDGTQSPLMMRPATDDQPYPYRYSTWSDLATALVTPGKRVDAAMLIAAALLLLALGASLVLILLPLVVLPRSRSQDPAAHGCTPLRWAVAAYFGLIGLAFLAVEIAWILVLKLFLDEPLYAAATVLTGFLVFAGLGSLVAQGLSPVRDRQTLGLAVAVIVAGGSVYLVWLNDWLAALAPLAFGWKAAIAIGLLAPLAFAMGIPFPIGLRAFGARTNALIPWAWGINGCASVISAVGAPLVALEFGYSGLLLAAVGAYVAAAVIFAGQRARQLTGLPATTR